MRARLRVFVMGRQLVRGSWNEDYYAGALPHRFHYINYVLYYDADKLADSDGNKSGTRLRSSALANVFRPIYVANTTILGANPAWHLVVPLVHKNVKSDLFDDNADGIGDIYVSPLILGWHSKYFIVLRLSTSLRLRAN